MQLHWTMGVESWDLLNSRQRRCGGGAAERVVEEGAPSACRGGREVAAAVGRG